MSEPTPSKSSWPFLVGCVLMFATVVVVGIVVVRFLQPAAVVPQSESPNAVAGTTPPGRKAENSPAVVKPPEDLATAAVRLEIRRISDSAESALRSLDELDAEIDLWQTEVLALLSNDAGRSIASEPDLVGAFGELVSRDRTTAADAASTRLRIAEVLTPIKAALESSAPPAVPRSLPDQLQREDSLIKQAVAAYRADRQQVKAWLLAGGPPAELTLQETIEAQTNRHAQEKAAAIAEKMRTIRTEEIETTPFTGQWYDRDLRYAIRIEGRNGTALLTRSTDKIAPGADVLTITSIDGVSFKGERTFFSSGNTVPVTGELIEATRLKLVSPDLESVLDRIEGDLAKLKADELRRLAEDLDVQARYKPFLAKGRYLFNYTRKSGMLVDGPARLASYNAIVQAGLTRDMRAFIHAGIGRDHYGASTTGQLQDYRKNDRPLWSTPYPNSDAEWARYRKLFHDFQELAPIWRDMGLLAP